MDLNLPPLTDKQGEAFNALGTEILYGGAAGGGKSHLMRIMAIVIALMVPNVQIYLFRRKYADLWANHMDGPSGFMVMLSPLIKAKKCKVNGSDNEVTFWNGAKIHLCHCQHEKDRYNHQGAEIHVLLIDELTHFTDVIYRFLRNRVRLGSLKVPQAAKDMFNSRFPLIFCGSNPGGVGHGWVKRTFVDAAPHGKAHRVAKKEGGMLRQYIPAKLSDNPIMAITDPDYADRLAGLGNPALVKAMLDGSWDIVAGGAFDDLWDTNCVILPRFKIPSSWYVDRSFDWGSTHPFSVGWWAESNGEEVELPDGTTACFPAGSLIRISEWYGTKEIGTNEGLKMSARDVATGIIEREERLIGQGWVNGPIYIGPADNQIRNVVEKESDSIEKKMSDQGIYWAESDKKAGSRVNGLQLARDRLSASISGEGPGLYFMENCKAAIQILPILARDEDNTEDIDGDQEDHIWDDIRYRVLASSNRIATKLNLKRPS